MKKSTGCGSIKQYTTVPTGARHSPWFVSWQVKSAERYPLLNEKLREPAAFRENALITAVVRAVATMIAVSKVGIVIISVIGEKWAARDQFENNY